MISGLLVLIVLLQLQAKISESAENWGYGNGDNGPANWDHVSPDCGGKKQSPIDFKNPEHKSDLGQFKLENYNAASPANSLDFLNNGHAIQLSFPGLDCKVSGGGLPGTFKLVQFHMHWGSTDCRGSEHTVEGRHYPLEIHYVHYNTKYADVTEALKHADGLAVLGVFVDVNDKKNTAFESLTKQITQVKYSGASVKLASSFVPESLLPINRNDFVRYSGSLTTPNCNEVVTWTVFNEPIYISHAQMNAMRGVSFDAENKADDRAMVDNYRPVMALNARKVYKSFTGELKQPSPPSVCGAMGNHFKPILVALALIVAGLVSRW